MNVLSALLLLASASEQLPDGPRLVLVPSNVGAAAVHIRFAVPDDAEEEATGRIFQASQAVTLANGALPRTWATDLFAGSAQMRTGSSREDLRFSLTAAPESFDALFATFVTAIFKSKLSAERFKKLEGHIPTQRTSMTSSGLLINAFAGRPLPAFPLKNRLLEFESVAGFVKRVVRPGNATIIVTGRFDEKAVRAVLAAFTGGAPIVNVHRPPKPSEGLFTGADDLYVVIYGFEQPTPELEASLLILQELLSASLLEVLRSAGATYSIDIVIHRLEGLTCLMWVVPSRDNSKLDLLPYIDRILEGLMKTDEREAFALAKGQVQKRLARAALSPDALVEGVDEGAINVEWLTPEFARVIRETTLPAIQRAPPLHREDRTVWRLVPKEGR